jgi:hypothetical protein
MDKGAKQGRGALEGGLGMVSNPDYFENEMKKKI